jgi:predicted nucleotidyltransferase component of viral defense system
MNNPHIDTANIEEWVNQETDPYRRELREAVHTVLHAIAKSQQLSSQMIMKGGILLAIRYHSSRFTKDIDFSTEIKYSDFDEDGFFDELQEKLTFAVEDLDYGLDCRIQSWEVRPKGEGKNFQTMALKIGYAQKGSKKHESLMKNNCSNVIEVDYSFNELTQEKEILKIFDGESLEVYSFTDLIAEKFRAILQQEMRNRIRRQDPYDLYSLLKKYPATKDEKQKILKSLIIKSKSRNLEVNKLSISDEKIKQRSEKEYSQLADEIEEPLPPFEEVYNFTQKFYESLPWP